MTDPIGDGQILCSVTLFLLLIISLPDHIPKTVFFSRLFVQTGVSYIIDRVYLYPAAASFFLLLDLFAPVCEIH